MVLQAQEFLLNRTTGQMIPYMVGTDAKGAPTNQVQIYYDRATGDVKTMFPVPITGGQGPQGFNGNSGSEFVPTSIPTASGNLTESSENYFTSTAPGATAPSLSSSPK